MRYFLKKTGIFLIAFMLAGIPTAYANDTVLYLLYDDKRAGEKNQVLGVANALKKYLPQNTTRKEFVLSDKESFLLDIRKNLKPEFGNKVIVVAAEVESIDVLKQFIPQPNMVIAHSSHQYTKEHGSLKNVADVVALPQYVVTSEILGAIESPYTVLIQTAGVPHNLSPKDIEEAYQKNKDILPFAEKYIGIILGGDAETPDKKLLYYTTAEARQMASYIAPFVKENTHLLILNGPRTGKHDQTTGKVIETSHRDGNGDAVTAAFIEELQSNGLKQGKDFTLLDFQFGKPSAYPVVLGALLQTKSPIFVAGDSTSMVSESADCLPNGLVTAYTDKAMNENHRKHCASEREAGRINILGNQEGKWQLTKAMVSDPKTSQPASQLIAQAIMKRFGEKTAHQCPVKIP